MPAEPIRLPLSQLAIADLPGDTPVAPDADRAHWLLRVRAWARALQSLRGRDVALACEDGFEFSAALFGAWQAGATPWMPADALPATLQRLHDAGLAFAGDLPGGMQAMDGDDGIEMHELDADACALVLFTSGSTGEPAAIRKTLRQLDAEVGALESAFGATVGDAVVHATVSHQHIYGLLFRVLWPLCARRRLAYTEQLTALGPQPVALVASPAHLKRLPETQDWRSLSQGLQVVFSSGGALPVDAARDVQRLWAQAPIEVFGSTESQKRWAALAENHVADATRLENPAVARPPPSLEAVLKEIEEPSRTAVASCRKMPPPERKATFWRISVPLAIWKALRKTATPPPLPRPLVLAARLEKTWVASRTKVELVAKNPPPAPSASFPYTRQAAAVTTLPAWRCTPAPSRRTPFAAG